MGSQFPEGLRLRHTARGHDFFVKEMSWSPDGRMLAAPCDNGTIEVWNAESGLIIRRISIAAKGAFPATWISNDRIITIGPPSITPGPRHIDLNAISSYAVETGQQEILLGAPPTHVYSFTRSPVNNALAVGCEDRILLLNLNNSRQEQLPTPGYTVVYLAWSPDGSMLGTILKSSGAQDKSTTDWVITVWNFQDKSVRWKLTGHTGSVNSLAWSSDNQILASSSSDHTVRLWDIEKGQHSNTLEGHTESVSSVDFSFDGILLASKSEDNSVRIWRTDTWETVAKFEESFYLFAGLAFHPNASSLATLGRGGKAIRIWDLDLQTLVRRPFVRSGRYVNAKVVLVGDTGVGKSGLGLVLSGQPFAPTDSTHGRRVWTLESEEVKSTDGRMETRETLLWDLAGQPGYRLIHQLHLNEVTVALVVFDARNDIDPLSGVRHWDRALRQAKSVQGDSALATRKFLIAARTDRGGIGVSRGRLELFIRNLDFDEYFETSAREGWKIEELRKAISESIDWDTLPKVSSTELFKQMKDFIIREKEGGWLLSTVDDLYRAFLRSHRELKESDELRAQFRTCIGRLESRDLIQRLSFGSLVLLQPEMLDAYASAIVNASKEEPDGLGCIAEENARDGQFPMPQDERIKDNGEERLLLIATVEDLLRHEIALREHTDDGPQLVFPSQLTRENPDLPDPEGKAVIFTFEGHLLNVYATLVVRLSHSGVFRRKDMWKNAVTFSAKVGGACGVFLREIEEGQGELALFFDSEASEETRFQFEEYILTHLRRRALPDSLDRRRVFVCAKCGETITNTQAERRRERGFEAINCPVCDTEILLLDRKERITKPPPSVIGEIDRAANAQRELDAGLVAAAGEMQTQGFKAWAGSSRTTLALVFTDIVDSTVLGNELGNEAMGEVRRAHFRQAHFFLGKQSGYQIKTIGDSLMVAFRTAVEALDFALSLSLKTGDERVRIRAGVHVGPVSIEDEDAFGTMVNFTNRIANISKKPEIWVSDTAKSNIDEEKAKRHADLSWKEIPDCELKGFPHKHTVWLVSSRKK